MMARLACAALLTWGAWAAGEAICRVCRSPGTPDAPLFYPCACSGSIKYIHEEWCGRRAC
jgi:E3 ubiquitin-protein ligase DOA10